jgi:uncharacterized protein YkwD
MRGIARYVLALSILGLNSTSARAAVLYTNNAESGSAGISTNVAGYSLIQSQIASQGTSAFHLANPAFTDNWFRITQPITIQADTKLFFQSRLGWATNRQFARVQASTDGGSTWPVSLYDQAGTDGSGEGGFTLKEVNLASYSGQALQFRFYYDFLTPGSAFTQTEAGVGWYVDDIQIADALQKSLYSIGNPSNEEQLYLEYINRARADAILEANRLKNETAPGVQSAYSFFDINPQNIVNQFTASVANGYLDQFAQPLSFNAALLQAAELHSQDMLNNAFQGHSSSGSPPSPLVPFGGPGERLDAVGYDGGWAENVYSYSDSVAEGHAGFDVDWGDVDNPGDPNYNPAFAGQGMQNPAGHRGNIHNNDYKEIGVGLVLGSNGGVGPQLVTQDFGDPGEVAFVTGVVYEDLNGNDFYDVGEGRSGVRVDVEGSAYYALSAASGGYSVPASGNGVLDVMFSGGGFANFMTTATITGGLNVKVDYLASAAVSYAADFDNDGEVDAADLAQWRGDFGLNGDSDADDDDDSDGADFLVWQRQLGLGASAATVPEPAGASLIIGAFGLLCVLRGRR